MSGTSKPLRSASCRFTQKVSKSCNQIAVALKCLRSRRFEIENILALDVIEDLLSGKEIFFDI